MAYRLSLSLRFVLLHSLLRPTFPLSVASSSLKRSIGGRSSSSSYSHTLSRRRHHQRRHIVSMTNTNKGDVTTKTTSLPSISNKIERTLDPCVVLMKELVGQYADLWKDKGGIYSLAQGVVYWKPPPQAITAMQESLQDPDGILHMYGPDEGLGELRDALSQKVADENGLDHHHVMVTVGANQAYVNCVLTLLDDDDQSVVFAPYYFNHVMALQMTMHHENDLLVGPTTEDGAPDLEWLEEALQKQQDQNDNDKRIKMVTIVNPGNPTGTNLPRDLLQRAVDLCREHNVWLILDCTYEYFVPDSKFDGCFTDPHVLHIFSFSKAYALAGYRCGYVAISKDATTASGGDVFAQMVKVQDTIPIAPPRISQVAALASLSVGRDWVRQNVATLDVGRKAILQALAPLERIIGGSGAMYVMGKLPNGVDDLELGRTLVKDFGVAVIPGSFCGFPGWIRVCYANLPPHKCLQAANRLAEGIQTLAPETD